MSNSLLSIFYHSWSSRKILLIHIYQYSYLKSIHMNHFLGIKCSKTLKIKIVLSFNHFNPWAYILIGFPSYSGMKFPRRVDKVLKTGYNIIDTTSNWVFNIIVIYFMMNIELHYSLFHGCPIVQMLIQYSVSLLHISIMESCLNWSSTLV